MKKLTLTLLFIATFLTGFANFPNHFKISEDIISIGTCFTLSDNLGTVDEELLSASTVFIYYNSAKVKTAVAKEAIFSFGTQIAVYDGNSNLIGYIKEEVLSSTFSVYAIYTIRDKNDRILAVSKKLDLFGTRIDLYDNSGNKIIELIRPLFNPFSDTWDVNVLKKGIVDDRILLFIPCYKTAADKERKKHSH